MTRTTITDDLLVNRITVTAENTSTGVTVADGTSIDQIVVATDNNDIAITISQSAAGVSSLNGFTGPVNLQDVVTAQSTLDVPGTLSAGQFSQGANNASGSFASYAENPVFHGYNLTIGGIDSGDNRQGITFTSSTPSGNAYLNYNDLTDKIEQSRDGTTYYPIPISTTELAEGTNLYYTQARADARVAAGIAAINYPVDSVNGQTNTVVLTTTDIAEGTNLYYTQERVDARVSAGIGAINYPVDSVNGQTNTVVLDTDDISEGTNKYFSTTLARGAVSGGTGVTYDVNTGVIAIGQSVATTADATFNTIKLGTGTSSLKRSDGSTLLSYSTGTDTIGLTYKNVDLGGAGLSTSYVNIDNRILMNSASLVTTTTTADQLLDKFNKTSYRAANYLIHIQGGGEFQIWEGMIIHNGTNAYLNAYGDLRTSTDNLATITAVIVGDIVEIRCTPVNAATTFKIQKTLMNV